MKKEFFKQNKGITLIALVITIVILIILATISINAVLGEDGLIKRVEKAGEHQANAEAKDRETMDEFDKYLSNVMYEEPKVEEKTLVAMYNAAVEAGCEGGESCTDAENHLHIGDYVNYQNPTSGSKTVLATDSGMTRAATKEGTKVGDQTFNIAENQLTWRVLGVDKETGGIKLIAGSPMKTARFSTTQDPYFYMYGATACVTEENGEIKAVNILNDVCSMYVNSYATKARSVTIDDINEITGVTTEDKIKEYNLNYIMNSESGEKQYGETYSFVDQYTPESYLNNETKTTVSGTVNGYFYAVNVPEEAGMPSPTVANTRAYNLMFNNVEIPIEEGDPQGASYWLASSGVDASSNYAYFGPGAVVSEDGLAVADSSNILFGSYGIEVYEGLAVRPVVVLKSDVTAKQVGKTEQTETEATWSYTANPNAE